MEDKSLALLSDRGIEIHEKILECKTFEELQAIVIESAVLNESENNTHFIELNISEEEFEKNV